MRRRWAFLCTCLSLCSTEASAGTPSFDCTKASTIDEQLICADPDLAALDAQLADAVRVVGVPLTRQRQWVSERNRTCRLSRNMDLATLDRTVATNCLYRAYELRLDEVRAIPVNGGNAPKHFPYLPRLTQDGAPDICRAMEAAQQESFKSSSPKVSAIDRSWPGLDMKWVISPATVSERDGGNLLVPYSVDLDADGKREILALRGQTHSWRGDVFSLLRFPSEADFKVFEAQMDKASPKKGESVLSEDWQIPGVLAVNGQYYVLDEGAVWEDTPPATLYRIPATGKPEAVCTVERRPDETTDWENRAGMSTLFADLASLVGGSGDCGTLNAPTRLAIEAGRMRTQALLRPWATDRSYNSRRDVDAWLAKWASEGLRNWDLHHRFLAHEPPALHSLSEWYGKAFGMTEPAQEARRVLDQMISGHFSFPGSRAPSPSPLATALLKGAPASEVTPLLKTAALGQPEFFGAEVSEEAPLVLAIRHPHLVRLLLDAGAPVNAVNSFGKTPLMYAAQADNAEVVRLLLAAGATVNARTRRALSCTVQVTRGDRTALHYAAENAGLEVMRLLVKAGAETGARDADNNGNPSQTPLDYLARNTKLSADNRQRAAKLLRSVP